MKITQKNKISPDRALDSQIESKALSGGYAIVELLFYISIFAVISVVVINSMITMTKSFRETSIQGELVQAGVIMERMSREVRQAYNISSVSASDLQLESTDSGGANKTVRFLLSGSSNLQLIENSVLSGNLNTSNIVITGLTFTQITTNQGQAVKILLSVSTTNDALNRTVDFYDTVVLRGGY